MLINNHRQAPTPLERPRRRRYYAREPRIYTFLVRVATKCVVSFLRWTKRMIATTPRASLMRSSRSTKTSILTVKSSSCGSRTIVIAIISNHATLDLRRNIFTSVVVSMMTNKSVLDHQERTCVRVSEHRVEADLLLRHRDHHFGERAGPFCDFAACQWSCSA